MCLLQYHFTEGDCLKVRQGVIFEGGLRSNLKFSTKWHLNYEGAQEKTLLRYLILSGCSL